MKRIVILALLFFNALISFGQKQHLEPATFFVGGGLENYYRNISSLCFEGMSSNPYARFIAIPSFSKEYAFSIEKENQNYFLISITLSESYWRAKNKENVKFETKKRRVDKKFYHKIGYLFQLLAKQTKSYEIEPYYIDGESFYFLTTDDTGAVKIGKTWSPDKRSQMGQLVKISHDLYFYGNGNKVSITEICSTIDNLIAELEK